MPWSCAAGMKWVPIRPLVLAPQMANVPASSQNMRVRAADLSAPRRAAGPAAGTGHGGEGSSVGAVGRGADVRRVVAEQPHTSGTTARAATDTVSADGPPAEVLGEIGEQRQEDQLPGRSPGGQDPGDETPPSTNHRHVTVATKASAIDPVPNPTNTPQHRMSCQLRHQHREGAAGGHQRQRAGDDPPHAEALHQGGGEG